MLLQLFVRAGLTPYDAISAATVNVGKFLFKPKTIGVIGPGAQADLILLKGNPLEDVKNPSQIAGVIRPGRSSSQQEILRGLDPIVAPYKKRAATHNYNPYHAGHS